MSAAGCVLNKDTGKPPTGMESSLLLKLGVNPPQGEVPSMSSSNPKESGYWRMKWAEVADRRARPDRRYMLLNMLATMETKIGNKEGLPRNVDSTLQRSCQSVAAKTEVWV